MKTPSLLRESTKVLSSRLYLTNQDNSSELHLAVWQSVNGTWGGSGPVILHDTAVCTRPNDHVTCFPGGNCHATSEYSPECFVHCDGNVPWWTPGCAAPSVADRAHVTALWNDFNQNYTGRRQ